LQPGRRGVLRRGFTLIELLVVIAIIGILITPLLSSVLPQRERERREAVSTEILALALAESTFLIENGQYGTLSELIDDGLVATDLADGKKHGYEFTIDIDPPPLPAFQIRADPCVQPLSLGFFVDESEVVRWALDGPADASSAPLVDLASIPTSEAENDLARQVEADAGELVRQLDALPGAGDAILAAVDLLATEDVQGVFFPELDANGDGQASVQDFLSADALVLARAVKSDLGLPDGPAIGDDADLEAMLASYQALLAATLAPDEETVSPSVSYTPALPGDPSAFLLLALAQGVPALGAGGLAMLALGLALVGRAMVSQRRL
jgi:prepilin-type N-terminal cleavage/methylation domain-containing protein